MSWQQDAQYEWDGRDAQVVRCYHLQGVVQGVGFRPHFVQAAAGFAVRGTIRNTGDDVELLVAGRRAAVEEYVDSALRSLPPLARVLSQSNTEWSYSGEVGAYSAPELADVHRILSAHAPARGIAVLPSRAAESGGVHTRTLFPPDAATCPECEAELHNPQDRRFGYPFITCTQCGPRLSIITDLPYDRPNTTLADFPMCPECTREYTTVSDRRYHAQPISCFNCGPRLWFSPSPAQPEAAAVACESADELDLFPSLSAPMVALGQPPAQWNRQVCDEMIAQAAQLLQAGKIVAVKGIGGFHLLADATNEAAVARLRQRKQRPDKPFAVLVRDDAALRKVVTGVNDPAIHHLLHGRWKPIVLLPKAEGASVLAEGVAPRLGELGVVLPYNPLYQLLFDALDTDYFICTSGNASGEPLCTDNEDAWLKLRHIADGFLFHNRPIACAVEDSVFRGTQPVRRSRGYAPTPVRLPEVLQPEECEELLSGSHTPCVLAFGGELKNSAALSDGAYVHLSGHIGDMESVATQAQARRARAQLCAMRDRTPTMLVADLHPGYHTTAEAQRQQEATGGALVQVQHHVAHALSLLGEHSAVDVPALVLALDGTGFGTDGTIWGGELLGFNLDNPTVDPWPSAAKFRPSWSRLWHVPTFVLPGGDRAARQPWRCAAGVAHAWGVPLPHQLPAEATVVQSMLASNTGCVATSSLGRLFDAAAYLITGITAQTYEGQAAMELEALAATAVGTPVPRAATWRQLLLQLLDAPSTSLTPAVRAWQFHASVAHLLAQQVHRSVAAVLRAHPDLDLSRRHPMARPLFVGVTGGCALNRVLVDELSAALAADDIVLCEHEEVPPNDGGLAYGQVIAGFVDGFGENLPGSAATG